MERRAGSSGTPMQISRSKRPARLRAESSESGRLVAPVMGQEDGAAAGARRPMTMTVLGMSLPEEEASSLPCSSSTSSLLPWLVSAGE
eukprot:760551-Hanusia_phi.AAC.3